MDGFRSSHTQSRAMHHGGMLCSSQQAVIVVLGPSQAGFLSDASVSSQTHLAAVGLVQQIVQGNLKRIGADLHGIENGLFALRVGL